MSGKGLALIYPGWRVLAGAFVCSALAIGFTSYIFGMFVVPVTAEFGISRANFNNGMIAFMLGMALVSPFVGRLLDRFSVRKIMVIGGISFGGAFMLMSRSESLWLMLGLIVLPLTFGAAACGVLGANTVVVRWFQRRRGRALGVVALSVSVGGFLSQPLTALLIDSFGWRNALFLIGLISMSLFLLMAAFLVRNRPTTTEVGYEQEFTSVNRESEVEGEVTSEPERVWTTRELLRSRNFWLVSIGIGLLLSSDQAMLTSQVPYFQDIGYDLPTVAVLVSVKAMSAIAGKLVVGALADKVDLRFLFAGVAGCNALLMMIYILQPSFWVLITAVALLGVAVGGVFPVWTTILAWLFGSRSYGAVMGLMTVIMQSFAMVGLRFIGEVHDRTGSYNLAFAVFIALAMLAISLVWMLRPERNVDGRPEESTVVEAV